MYNEPKGKSQNGDTTQPMVGGHLDNRIDALRSLAALLLREVESLEGQSLLGRPSFDPSESGKERLSLSGEVERIEIDMIRRALILAKGNQRRAATILGTKATTLHAKIKRYGVEHFSALGKL